MVAFVAHLGLPQMIGLASLPLLVLALVVVRRRTPVVTRPEVTVTQQVVTRRSRRFAQGSTPPPFTAASYTLPRVVPAPSKRKTGLRPTHARR